MANAHYFCIEVMVGILNLATTVQLIAIVTFIATVLNYTIIKPLKDSISALERTIAKMDSTVERLVDNDVSLDRRLTIVEQSAKSAHHRIDEIKGGH